MTRSFLAGLPDRLEQPAFERTGGVHATGLFDPTGELVLTREDVGRHNAMDKVVGRMLLDGFVPLGERILCVSGRLSFELVQKAAVAGAPILVGVGAPSSLAVSLADDRGMTLCGFTRRGSTNVYTHAERVASGARSLDGRGTGRARPRAPGPTDAAAGGPIHAATSATSRSISSSEVHAPTDARTTPNAGMLRTITPSPASRATSASDVLDLPRDQRRAAARQDLEPALGQPLGEQRPPATPRARAPSPSPPSSNTPSDAAAHALRIPAGKPWSSRLTPSACSNSSAFAGIRHRAVARPRHEQVVEAVRAHEQAAAALGTAQPLLARPGVEVAAERAHVDRHRPERLRGVEQHRHAGGDERGHVGHLAADPRNVRARDQPRRARDLAGDLGERDHADLDPVRAGARARAARAGPGCSWSEVRISSPGAQVEARRSRC